MGTDHIGRVRHVLGLFAAGVVLVFAIEPLLLSAPLPLLSRLGAHDRVELYKLIAPFTATLLGFVLTAVAILVALDVRKKIVQEIQERGEGFSLLIVNLLAAALFLFLATVGGIVGAVSDDGVNGANFFESAYEVVLLTSIFEVALGGFYFAMVTYKVATHD